MAAAALASLASLHAHWAPRPIGANASRSGLDGLEGALDCHCNWTAAYHLMKKQRLDHAPCTVTAEFHVKLLRPTPSDAEITLKARVVDSTEDRATVEAELIANGKICDTFRGTFVSVKEGHPAYHRW